MRISERFTYSFFGVLAGLTIVLALPSAALAQLARDSAPVVADTPAREARAPLAEMSAAEAYRAGALAYRSGDKQAAVAALQAAARQGHPVALWKLGHMYAEGDGVERNDLTAFDYFRQLADGSTDINPREPRSRLVSRALVELADYYLAGIPNSQVGRNIGYAVELLMHAATYFGDPEAQHELAMVYLEQEPVQPARAARWLLLSARKGHVMAQCELGKLLFSGAKGVTPRPMEGLMWLEIAYRTAVGKEIDKAAIEASTASAGKQVATAVASAPPSAPVPAAPPAVPSAASLGAPSAASGLVARPANPCGDRNTAFAVAEASAAEQAVSRAGQWIANNAGQ